MKLLIILTLLGISLPVSSADLPPEVSVTFKELGNCVAFAGMANKKGNADSDYYIAMRVALAAKFFELSQDLSRADSEEAWDKLNVGVGFVEGEAFTLIKHNIITDDLTYPEIGKFGFKGRCAQYHDLVPNKPAGF